MSHGLQPASPSLSELAVERRYQLFLERLSAKGRASMQRHDEISEMEGPPEHAALWKRFAGRLTELAGHAIEPYGLHALRFYIADGKYKQQVFALEDTRRGTIVLHLPDVVPAALEKKILSGDPASHEFKLPGNPTPLHLAPIDAESRDLTLSKAMVGWGRRARRVEFGVPWHETHVKTVERLCELAAQSWNPPAPSVTPNT